MAEQTSTAERERTDARAADPNAARAADLGRAIGGGDPQAAAVAQRLAAGDTAVKLPSYDFQSEFYSQGRAICQYQIHLDRYHFRFGSEVLTCTAPYASMAGIEVDERYGFATAPIEKVREAVAADPNVTK